MMNTLHLLAMHNGMPPFDVLMNFPSVPASWLIAAGDSYMDKVRREAELAESIGLIAKGENYPVPIKVSLSPKPDFTLAWPTPPPASPVGHASEVSASDPPSPVWSVDS